MKLTANTIIKLFVNSIGQDALKDFYEHNWDACKKEIQKQKLSKAEYDFDLIQNTDFQRVMDMLDEFTDWALKKDYINSWDKYAIIDLLIPYMKALQFKLPDGKLEGVFGLFLALVKDKRKLYDYWDSKRFEIDENNSGDLKLLINRWTVTKKARPTWKVIKLFMNEDLLPDDNLIIQPFPDISGKDQYLIFRRKIFSAYFITNFFHYLREFEFINEVSIEMIQNGIRLFYRHFLITNEPIVSQEEKQNPMFCMLYNFLFTDAMGIDFNKDTRFYFGI